MSADTQPRIIGRRYQLHNQLGQGGMGEVYQGLDTQSGKTVAIKILKPKVIPGQTKLVEQLIKRFKREGEVLRQLKHPNIVNILATSEENGQYYIVMEYVDGGSLADLLRTQPQLPFERALNITSELADALACVHHYHIVHRDIKPANVLLTKDGTPRLTDFGVAYIGDRSRVTQTGAVIGTYAYLSPEACRGEQPDARTDIWSLGVTLYQMLAGRCPFAGNQPATILLGILGEPLPPLTQFRSDVPSSLVSLIHRMLMKDRDERISNMRRVIAEMETTFRGLGAPLRVPESLLEVTSVDTDVPHLAIPVLRDSDIAIDEQPTQYHRPALPTYPTGVGSASAILIQHADETPELPRPRLIGRDNLLAEVQTLLDQGEPVLLQGLGGMGKTALAATVTAQHVAAGKGPALWLYAGQGKAENLFRALASRFDKLPEIAGTTGQAQIQAVRNLLAQSNASLLVVDDVWEGPALRLLIKAVPRSMPLLVTSRHRFPTLQRKPVDRLDRAAALQLLSYHAKADLTDDEASDVLCEQLGDHAFALKVAGLTMAVDDLAPAELLVRIADVPHDLAVPTDFAAEGRESVKALLDASVHALDDVTRDVLQTFGGLFSPSVTPELMTLCIMRDSEIVDKALTNLQRHGLAQRVRQPDNNVVYYTIHDLTHSYARAMFSAAGLNRHAVIEACREYITVHKNDLDALDIERKNILGAAEAARQSGQNTILVEMMRRLAVDGPYFSARGYAPIALELLKAAIEAAKITEQLQAAHRFLGKLGDAYVDFLGKLDSALTTYREALDLARTLDDHHREAIILSLIGTVRFRQGAGDAEVYYDKAVQVATAHDDDFALSSVLIHRGYYIVSKEVPDYATGRHIFDKVRRITARLIEAAPDPSPLLLEMHFFSLMNRGGCEHGLGQLDPALSTLQEAYRFAEEQDNHYWMGWALNGIGRAYTDLGDREQAEKCLNEALRLYRQIGSTARVATLIEYMEEENFVVKPE